MTTETDMGTTTVLGAEVRNRLAQTARLMAGTLGLVLIGAIVAILFEVERATDAVRDIGLTTIGCLGIAALARSRLLGDRALLDVALGFEVVLCTLISFGAHFSFGEAKGILMPITWVVPLIILFPLIIPTTPKRTLITAILAASTDVIARLVVAPRLPYDPASYFGIAHVVLAVALAYFGARILYRINVDIARAKQLGAYTLTHPIGEGGMGQVWRAEHRMLARPAAVKLIRADALRGDAESLEHAYRRFEREARATAALRSPHTVELYDFGRTPDGTLFYAMELLDGLDLESMLNRYGPLPAGRVIYLLRQICASLEDAHRAGLLHRDIKPANIFVCRLGTSFDVVKVLDFGLVKSVGTPDDVKLTAEGATAGTPAYMPPEVIGGEPKIGPAADIYALGCVAYWMLTGHLVFEASTPIKMFIAHAAESPSPPSTRTELSVPAELDALVMRCLAKTPEDRPPSMAALAGALGEIELERADLERADLDAWTHEHAVQWWSTHVPTASFSATPSVQPSIFLPARTP